MNFKATTKTISKASTIVIFLALIRCIAEPFRLQYVSSTTLTFDEIKPFLIGGLITAVALLLTTVLNYYAKQKAIIAVCVVAIAGLLLVRELYLVH